MVTEEAPVVTWRTPSHQRNLAVRTITIKTSTWQKTADDDDILKAVGYIRQSRSIHWSAGVNSSTPVG